MKYLLGLYVASCVFMAISVVGRVPKSVEIDWLFPFFVYGVITLPAIVGYAIGREEK